MLKEFTKGLWRENPTFGQVLGLCPTLAVTTSAENAVGMSAAATFVLVLSNTLISALRRFFPPLIRIPCFIVVVASFVSALEMIMKAFFPDLDRALGIFIPLIVVNCIILGRAEAFASRNGVLPSILDGLGMGAGFGVALLLIGTIREVLGAGRFFGIPITRLVGSDPGAWAQPIGVLTLAPGAFILMGLLLAGREWLKRRGGTR
ncbi:MAG: electron transport complex subunit E [Planctomycetes bacterium]|nr:electron transport complex subunit E [Planctomycetota bacterium]